jgi:hypothetical protein
MTMADLTALHQALAGVVLGRSSAGHRLEAIADLLGHKSLSMTLVYARIADRTVADVVVSWCRGVVVNVATETASLACQVGRRRNQFGVRVNHRIVAWYSVRAWLPVHCDGKANPAAPNIFAPRTSSP